MFEIRRMTLADAEAVNALRLRAYRSASWFQTKDTDALRVESDYPNTVVLCAYPADAPNQLVATLAATMNFTKVAVERALGADLTGIDVPLPGMSLGRLGVETSHQGLALNHLLRLYCLRAAKELQLAAMYGSQATGTPTIPAMKALGYEHFNVPVRQGHPLGLDDKDMNVYILSQEKLVAVEAAVQALLQRKGIAGHWAGVTLCDSFQSVTY